MNRRDLFGLGAAAAASCGAAVAPARADVPAPGEFISPVPMPISVPAVEGYVAAAGARIWYWDTGGTGPAVILGHPGTGSGLIWGYQQPVFARAGFRVIGYSRRGYARSEITDASAPHSDVGDLLALADHLALSRFHLVGSAAGGGTAISFAVSHADRLRSLVIANSLGFIVDEEYDQLSKSLRPKGFESLPPDFRELGPCYRAADPAGTARWLELEKMSRPARAGEQPTPRLPFTGNRWADVEKLTLPLLWLTGDADLYTPPPVLAHFHRRSPGSRMDVIQGSGHSAYWEQPAAFNRVVLDFLRRAKG